MSFQFQVKIGYLFFCVWNILGWFYAILKDSWTKISIPELRRYVGFISLFFLNLYREIFNSEFTFQFGLKWFILTYDFSYLFSWNCFSFDWWFLNLFKLIADQMHLNTMYLCISNFTVLFNKILRPTSMFSRRRFSITVKILHPLQKYSKLLQKLRKNTPLSILRLATLIPCNCLRRILMMTSPMTITCR